MQYPYFDILFRMADAIATQREDLRLGHYHDRITLTEYGLNLESKSYYITPDGEADLAGYTLS